jgi:hypothetical protein
MGGYIPQFYIQQIQNTCILFSAQIKILKRPTHLLFGRAFFSAGMKILPACTQAPRPTTSSPTLKLLNRAGPLNSERARPIISLIVPLTKMAATKHKRKSTHASAKSKKAKGGIAGNAPSGVNREAVPWRDVWAAMKRSGWSWKGWSSIMTDYYYIKPKCRVQSGLSGWDYFVCVEDAMEFARDCNNWHKN